MEAEAEADVEVEVDDKRGSSGDCESEGVASRSLWLSGSGSSCTTALELASNEYAGEDESSESDLSTGAPGTRRSCCCCCSRSRSFERRLANSRRELPTE